MSEINVVEAVSSVRQIPGTAYAAIAELSEDATRSGATFTGLITPEPYRISAREWRAINGRNAALREWHATSLPLFDASLCGDAPNDLDQSRQQTFECGTVAGQLHVPIEGVKEPERRIRGVI